MRAAFVALLVVAASGAGCVDPEQRYEDFIDRTAEVRTRDAGVTEPSDRFDWSGHYLLALSTTLAPDSPLLFAVDAEVSADLATISLELQPLATDDDDEPRAEVGDRFELEDIAYQEDGTFSADLGDVSVPGRANPITGSDIVANVQLSASTQAEADAREALFCGRVAGMVVEPIALDLAGSTFGALRSDDDHATEPLLRCP